LESEKIILFQKKINRNFYLLWKFQMGNLLGAPKTLGDSHARVKER
jgi:hypothetical protein